MCIFHKWEWNKEIGSENWKQIRYDDSEIQYTRNYQDAYCKKCGKYKKRYLN